MAVIRERLLLADGTFLMVAGIIQMTLELAGHWNLGPYASMFHESAYTIGFVEAHGLAILIGCLLRWPARREPRRYWHLFAAVVHLLLGGANILFWSAFVTFDTVAFGLAATIVHGVFILAQSRAWLTWAPARAKSGPDH